MVGFFLTAAAFAQPREDVQWAVALASRFTQLHEPVVAAYGFARLGSVVCAKDRAEGAELLRQSLARLNLLSLDDFTRSARVLPAASFSALYKMAMGAADKCDPAVEAAIDSAAAQAKMTEEQRLANRRLEQSRNYAEPNPDRAAQLIRAAITSSVPGVLDMSLLGKALSELRAHAPDLTDDLFSDALDFVVAAPAPDPSLLMELGRYLFTSPQYQSSDDKDESGDSINVGTEAIADLRATRNSASADDVQAYINAALKVLTASNDPNYDAVAAYAVAIQMLPKARDVAPDQVDALQSAVNQLAAQTGGLGAQIQAKVGGGAADPNQGEGPRLRDRIVSRLLSAAGAGRIVEARSLLRSVDDFSVRSQLARLVDFAEASADIGKKDIQPALALSAGLRPGIKRCLLYCGIQAASTREAALAEFAVAAKETEALPAEQRAFLWSAIASSMLRLDLESVYLAINQTVAALNDA
ncbi:MAG TPA: hypothetical protein VGS58_00490, partial [Candidatus Sulfopaludibacter sp.]|nr:hypothetical protein [Candidatus Sulfopaludibacter sp.]